MQESKLKKWFGDGVRRVKEGVFRINRDELYSEDISFLGGLVSEGFAVMVRRSGRGVVVIVMTISKV